MLKTHQRLACFFWLIVGVYTIISAYQLGLGRMRQPGPGFIFLLAALSLVILNTIDLALSFIAKPKTEKEKRDEPVWLNIRWQKIFLTLIGISVYICAFNFLGFLLSTFLLMIFLFKTVEPTKWWVALTSSLITILISYALFRLWLKVPFPQGILGF
jgi:putative tricarboxylic transport membrane protein